MSLLELELHSHRSVGDAWVTQLRKYVSDQLGMKYGVEGARTREEGTLNPSPGYVERGVTRNQ